ncbi:MAG: 16S rRNA (guanine(527)-N(7))-methyltransferase RsmG [Proteobacteria bacterium]|nr:16S rRNA (guanine(527)-N(7))-methyltransferase RsmG [Pseudomonadota bacterium]
MNSPHLLSREGFADLARELLDVSRETFDLETMDRLDIYGSTLRTWQSRINLVSNKSLDDLWRRHFLDSLQLARWIDPDMKVLDLGSGAGFPGLVLSIVTGAPVVLAESDSRKCAFLREVRRLTDANAEIAEGRIEGLDAGPFDVVVARALAPLTDLLGHASGFLNSGGFCLFLKGARVEDELTDAAKNWNIQVEQHQSLSEPDGTVLRIRKLSSV